MADDNGIQLTPREQRNGDPGRLLTFTDGVFAIIITILVLDIKVPDLGSGQSFGDSLAEMRPTFIAFVISFLLVGMYWTEHRSTFNQVRYVDHNAIWLNLLFLLPVSLVPFASSAVGEYSEEATALHIYGVVLIAAMLLRLALNSYFAHHPGLMWDTSTKKSRWLTQGTTTAPLVIYVVAMLLAGSMPSVSLLLYFSIPVLYFLLVAFLKADPRTEEAASGLS
jgi:uncharacterized membrane protein